MDAAVDRGALRVRALWGESGAELDRAALVAALERHAGACGVDRVVLPKRLRVNPAPAARTARRPAPRRAAAPRTRTG
jgi:hypothetical protein